MQVLEYMNVPISSFYFSYVITEVMISSWLAFTFVVLKKIFAIFWTKQPRNFILWVLLTCPNLRFHKNMRYSGKSLHTSLKIRFLVLFYGSWTSQSLWFRPQILLLKKRSWWPLVLNFAFVYNYLFYKICMHRQYPTIKTSKGRALTAELLKLPSDSNVQLILKTIEKRISNGSQSGLHIRITWGAHRAYHCQEIIQPKSIRASEGIRSLVVLLELSR